ncbi:hypothetical protein [Streptosporangium sp. NPDC023615]|uniref:hypothetical protein n=1 Tax=Streptosporangium sp. NPDC023615 TaxID=3154794 RepID=UPI0034126C07
MSFAEHIAPILRAALEVLREADRPLRPDEVREAVTERVSVTPEHQAPDAHGQPRWWAQLGFRTGEAASLGWMSKRNGWSITPAGVQALESFPGVELYRELGRQYRARRMPVQGRAYAGSGPDHAPPAFEQFQRNLEYARQLVHGGRSLERLKVGAFDVSDLYRAAWTQAVAALDHWVTREIIDRAVALALQPGVARPPRFSRLSIPVELFERVHHHDEPLGEAFRAHVEQVFAHMTFQNPEKIKEGFGHVSTVNLWVRVAEILTGQDPAMPITADGVRGTLREIAWRRNNIAHTADHDPDRPGQKAAIGASEAEETISWLESIAVAIQQALGDPLPVTDYDAAPVDAGSLGAAPPMTGEQRTPPSRGWDRWDEDSLLHAIERYCLKDVAGTLLAVYRHAERHPSFRGYHFGEAEYLSVTTRFDLGTDEAAVWSIYTGVSNSVLSINFEWMRNRGASPERLARLADALSVLPGWAQVPGQLLAANYARRPSLAPAALARPGAPEIVTAALDDLLAVNPRFRILPPQPPTWYRNPKSTAARGGCSQHGTPPCHDEIVASVVLSNARSDDNRWAVCRRGLEQIKAGFPSSR